MGAQEPVRWQVKVGGEQTSAIWEPGDGPLSACTLMLAHGASLPMDHPAMANLAAAFVSHGLSVARFNFLYAEQQKGPPDRMPRLMECYAAVVAHVREQIRPQCLMLGGRSMGGRAASMLAAEGLACDGVLLLAYPLHPAGQPEKMRDEHLVRIGVPTLCVNGTRDELCQKELMEQVLIGLPATFTIHWLEGADHGFRVQKRSGRTDADVLDEVARVTGRWASGLPGCRPGSGPAPGRAAQ